MIECSNIRGRPTKKPAEPPPRVAGNSFGCSPGLEERSGAAALQSGPAKRRQETLSPRSPVCPIELAVDLTSRSAHTSMTVGTPRATKGHQTSALVINIKEVTARELLVGVKQGRPQPCVSADLKIDQGTLAVIVY
jgi:hypothetical protein